MAILNIGLKTNDGGEVSVIRVSELISYIARNGAHPFITVQMSNTEATAVVITDDAPYTEEVINNLCRALKQDAIAQWDRDAGGSLYGPKAADWGPFNPEFFLMPSGRPLADFLATRGAA